MRKVILVTCLIASIYAYHQKYDFNIVLEEPEYTKVPAKYELGKSVSFPPMNDAVKQILLKLKKTVDESGSEAILNDYADEIFANIRTLIIDDGFDPIELPEEHAGFNYTLIILFHGELDLTSGWLSDLSTLHRGGDVVVSYSSNSEFLDIAIPIDFDDLEFSYDYKAQIMGLGPSGTLEGKINSLKIYVKITVDLKNLVLILDDFYITNSGDITLQFTGDAIVDWLLDLLTEVVVTLLKEVILLVVEGVVKGGLQSAIDSINEAIGSILNPVTATTIATTAADMVFK